MKENQEISDNSKITQKVSTTNLPGSAFSTLFQLDNPQQKAYLKAYVEAGGNKKKAFETARVQPWTVFNWYCNESFRKAYDWVRVYLLEGSMVEKGIEGQSTPQIFFLKNRDSARYRDDNILQRIYLQKQETNFNFIKTEVNEMDNAKLLSTIQDLTKQCQKLKGESEVIDVE